MELDVLQAITHSLSYTYQRCPCAVKVSAPVYYVHLIAEVSSKTVIYFYVHSIVYNC